MEKNYKHLLQERLTYCLDWKADWEDWFKHQEINEKAKQKLYENRKFFGLVLNFYFLPINFLKYYKQKRAQHTFNKVLITIQVLKEEIDLINNNVKGEKNERY